MARASLDLLIRETEAEYREKAKTHLTPTFARRGKSRVKIGVCGGVRGVFDAKTGVVPTYPLEIAPSDLR